MQRRLFVSAGAMAFVPPLGARPARSGGPRLRVGADPGVVDAGLAHALRQAFGRDTGIGLDLVAMPAMPLLAALAAGELDVTLSNAPAEEARLDSQGLAHDRRAIAAGSFVLVGPGLPSVAVGQGLGAGPPAASRRWPQERPVPITADVVGMLRQIQDLAPLRGLVFLSAGDGSGAHLAEQAAWRLAGIAPAWPWYRTSDPAQGAFIDQVAARGAFAVVGRGTWAARGRSPLAILAEDPARLVEAVHAMRSFRSPHPAAKLFVAWISGARGQNVVSRVAGYRPVRAGRP